MVIKLNKLYIVRHGKTNWNLEKRIQGLTDIELNEIGIKEAEELSKTINIDKIDICISSPLKRTRKTAEILVNNKKEIIFDELLIERSFGDYEGKKISEDLIPILWDYKLNYSKDNIENIKECLNRANKFLNKIKKLYPNKTILIVSHGAFIKALHYNIIGYNKDTDFLSFIPKNSTLYEYNYKGE